MKEKKEKTIIARCTEREEKRITELAEISGKKRSRYIVDCCLSGKHERNKDIIREKIKQNILIVEEINQIVYLERDGASITDIRIKEEDVFHKLREDLL